MDDAHLDLRGLPIWERPALVFDAFDKLPSGSRLTFVTENEPRGLSARIEQSIDRAVLLEPRRVGDREWHVTLSPAVVENGAKTPDGILRRCAVFSGIEASAREALASVSTIETVRRGETIVAENTYWPFIGIVCDGVAALTSGEGRSRSRMFYEVFTGEVFGETEFFDDALCIGRVIALAKGTRYLRIPRASVAELVAAYPRIALGLGDVLAQRTRTLAGALAAQTTMPIVARVATVLLPYALPERGLSAALPALSAVTQAQIAAAAGTVKEVAARAISELEELRLLKRERGHIRFLDRSGLLELVKKLS